MASLSTVSHETRARILAFIALRGTVELDDLRVVVPLQYATRPELLGALGELLAGGQVEQRIAQVRYRDGDRHLRRDVATYRLKGGGA